MYSGRGIKRTAFMFFGELPRLESMLHVRNPNCSGDLRVRLLLRSDRIFVTDQGIRVVARGVDQTQTLVGRRPGVERGGAGANRVGRREQKPTGLVSDRCGADTGVRDLSVKARADVRNRVRRVLRRSYHAGVSVRSDASRNVGPCDRRAVVRSLLPSGGRKRQVLCEQEGHPEPSRRWIGTIAWCGSVTPGFKSTICFASHDRMVPA